MSACKHILVPGQTHCETCGEQILHAGPADHKAMDTALIELRQKLFQAMGIVRMASSAIREPGYDKAETDAWTSLDAAHALLSGVADRLQSSSTVLVGGSHGEY